jgi:hypothetical protein
LRLVEENANDELYSTARQPAGTTGTTGASGLIKVLVSDGFYTAQDTSNNPLHGGQ